MINNIWKLNTDLRCERFADLSPMDPLFYIPNHSGPRGFPLLARRSRCLMHFNYELIIISQPWIFEITFIYT